ncbi:MAG: LysR substrate-binding domain-containing protein [Pseudomonadales bacterium]
MVTPSINAIETFDVVAREKNFSRAASVLHITPSAVSHRIKLLEEQLGTVLFNRLAQGVELTAAGQALHEHSALAMQHIHDGVLRSQFVGQREKLTVATIPSLCQQWLIPRLKAFKEVEPNIDLEFIAQRQIADFSSNQIDAHLHFGSGQYHHLHAHKLSAEYVFPVCSPALLERGSNLQEIIEQSALLHYRANLEDAPGGVSWSDWCQHFALSLGQSCSHLWFSQVSMTLEAAAQGLGIALAWERVATDALATGKLVRIGEEQLSADFGYYLVAPKKHFEKPSLNAFCRWLAFEISASK